ncbi:alkene reductase [Pseudoalteromonas spongiae]|uniref:alkene reductase n=1 Tax=Pseudoalteromonas spongiae TaxID=298657 RepID=UPI00026CA388|nr:alkene reductase [Pseudoalteromonas spongiae]ATD01477.1 N-ethylmaleimide reductase [Pseudoalteromonas spongiae UST010723-006]
MKNALFNTGKLGNLNTNNKVVMAPMTRSRTAQPGDIPTDLMATYYAQRASAGFIVSEATQISAQGKGYSFTPGIYTQAQIDGWKKVTHAVHNNGGIIFSQLWHVGRMSHSVFHSDGLPVAPSALAPDAQVWIVGDDGVGRMLDCPTPRALSTQEIKGIVADYRQAAANAIEAGFNGVEVHAGNGYLIDQFLRATSNKRDDEYGGSLENRIRFALEIIKAISNEIGAERTAIRLAPFITQRGMNDPEAIDAILLLAKYFDELDIAYIHLAESDWDDAPTVTETFRQQLRKNFSGAIVVAGNYTPEKANDLISDNLVDYVAFGRKFLANPDLPYRLENNLPLNEISDPSTLFGGDERGYTDYPIYGEQ